MFVTAVSTSSGEEFLRLAMAARRVGQKTQRGIIPDSTSHLWARERACILRAGAMVSRISRGLK